MIQLKGQIRVQRLSGKVNLVASSAGGGGPLQAKTAYPSHSEQIIAPDEDYYGLVSVTVKPVPRIKALDLVVIGEGPIVAVNSALLEFGAVSVTIEEPDTPDTNKKYALYNGIRLPTIPEDLLAQYPYAWIRDNKTKGIYELILSESGFKYAGTVDDLGNKICPMYSISQNDTSATEWVNANNTQFSTFGLDSNRTILWSNHDIMNGTYVHFAGSEAVPTD